VTEQWQPVLAFEGRYEVSDLGAVRNARTGVVLKPRLDSDGYQLVTLWSPKKVDLKVHHLVLCAFTGPAPKDRPECDHRNGERADNRLSNLHWVTVSQNRRNLHTEPRGASGVRGVRFRADKPTPWQAYARRDGRFVSIGHFMTAEAALAARVTFDQEVPCE
jgi:NUMOD4 motif/HNH endonuclease